MELKEHRVFQGTYIPDTGIEYPEIPDQFIVPAIKVRDVNIDETYPYLDNSFYGRFNRFIIYAGAFLIAFPMNRIRYGLKISGKKNIRKNKKYFKNGVVTVSNHVYRWDFLAVLASVKYRTMFFPARTDHIEGPDSFMIRGIGGIPISRTLSGGRKFNQAFDELHAKKKWIHVFPEATRWDFYEPIRPFKKGAFIFSYRWNVPVIPMAFSYRKPDGIYKLLKVKHPLVTLNIGEPVFPDVTLGRKEAVEKMRSQVHESVVKLAGIEQNKWDSQGD